MAPYEQSLVAVDPVIFTISDNKLKVLLKKREKDSFKGKFELLGGLLQGDETAEETLARKLKEDVGENAFFKQFHTFTEPKRDPRGRTVSIGFLALIPEENIRMGKDWFSIDDLPALAFDHEDIIKMAYQYLKDNLNSQIVMHFFPDPFPLNKLQKVHEIITGGKLDNRNFRKKMISSGVVESAGDVEKGVSHRPAKLFRFSKED